MSPMNPVTVEKSRSITTAEQPSEPVNMTEFGPICMVVVQPTSFCNLDCDYCYLPNRHLRNQMSLELIEPIFQRVFTSQFLREDVTICWHAGEPLAVPRSFYETAFAKIEQIAKAHCPADINFNHSFQTNGLLITQPLCDLFKRYPVHVGVSIDGPAFLHDVHRKTRTGLGSHAGALKGIDLLRKNEIPTTAIAVLTADSLDYPDEIFDFFVEQGIMDVGFNMEETEGINTQSSLNGNDRLESRYRAFLSRIWERIAQTNNEFQLREFESICSLVYTNSRLDNTDMNHPFRLVNIDHLGNFSTFDPELLSMPTQDYGDFILGNVVTHSFEDVCQTQKFKHIYQDMQKGVTLCRETCDYFGVCGGGAGSNKYWENGTFASAETHACRYRIKAVTDLVLARLEQYVGLGAE